jgi:hypothetical protein
MTGLRLIRYVDNRLTYSPGVITQYDSSYFINEQFSENKHTEKNPF